MTSLIVGMVLLASPSFDWQAAADKIAPHMAKLDVSRDGHRITCDKFTCILGKLGLRASYDKAQKKQTPGLYVQDINSIATPKRLGGNSLAFVFRRKDTKDNYYDDSGALVAFLKRGRAVKGYVLASGPHGEELMQPESAALLGNRLIISGLHDWYGNGAQVQVDSYRLARGRYRLQARKTAEFESWGSTGIRLSNDGTQFMPIRIQSRTYPKYLYASHATAHLTYDEEWRFPAGIPKLSWKRLRDTPYNALDDLYGAIQHRNRKKIAYRSRSQAVAKAIMGLYPRTQKGRPDVEFVNSYCDSDAKVLVVANLKVWFHFVRYKGKWVVAKLTPFEEE